MNDTYIVTSYVVIDDLLTACGFQDDQRARISAAEILTAAVLAAKYFQNHHERAVGISGSDACPAPRPFRRGRRV